MNRIAVVGCGAIADSFHLPALAKRRSEGIEVVLVDPDETRAERLGRKYGFTRQARSHVDVLGEVGAAIIASPHETHVPIATACVEAGVHVLSEKPLGTSAEEVERLASLAAASGVTIAVNQTRRFIPACRHVKELIGARSVGDPVRIRVREGDRFDWPAATPSMFGARSGGKGILLDIGAHVLDLLAWWLGPDLRVVDYADDSLGGSEATVRCSLAGAAGTADVALSWLVKQPNTYRFEGPTGAFEWGVYDLDLVTLTEPSRRVVRLRGAARSYADLAPLVLDDFLRACRTGSPPAASAADVLPSMRLMDACYAMRRTLDAPWHIYRGEPVHG